MAEEQKPVAEVTPEAPAAEPAVQTKTEETQLTTETPTTEPAASAAEPTAATEAPATTTGEETADKEEEVAPVSEGHLEHKGANFPKNFIFSKKLFWFGSEPVDTKALASFKADKAVDAAHHVAAWAAETGKGLLFYSEKGDKATPHGAIHLADATEPTADGANKFHFSVKGLKHTFRASTAAERDNWISQLKLKIAEAKKLVPTVTESETYKNTLESFKPAPKKEEKPTVAEAAAEEPAKEEPAKDGELPAEEVKREEPKRRSASRKRTSIFGSLLGGKKEEERKVVEPAPETPEEVAETATETPAEVPAAETTEPAAEPSAEASVPAETAPVTETKPEEPKAEESRPDIKATKRGSIFGSLLKKKTPEPEAVAVVPPPAPTTDAVAETAPIIPAMETTEPLTTEATKPETAPVETGEASAAATNGEAKKEVKSDKRKSSLPFGFGKKDKSSSSDEETDKPKSASPFSKLRATINRKGKAEKPTEKIEDKTEEVDETEATKEGEQAKIAQPETAVEPAGPVETPISSAPVIQATA